LAWWNSNGKAEKDVDEFYSFVGGREDWKKCRVGDEGDLR
jgi:hypothetical protein